METVEVRVHVNVLRRHAHLSSCVQQHASESFYVGAGRVVEPEFTNLAVDDVPPPRHVFKQGEGLSRGSFEPLGAGRAELLRKLAAGRVAEYDQ